MAYPACTNITVHVNDRELKELCLEARYFCDFLTMDIKIAGEGMRHVTTVFVDREYLDRLQRACEAFNAAMGMEEAVQ